MRPALLIPLHSGYYKTILLAIVLCLYAGNPKINHKPDWIYLFLIKLMNSSMVHYQRELALVFLRIEIFSVSRREHLQ